jgi:flagellar protein FlaG
MEQLKATESRSNTTTSQLKSLETMSRELASLSKLSIEKSDLSNPIKKTTQVNKTDQVLQAQELKKASDKRAILNKEVQDRVDDVLAYLNNEMRMRSRQLKFSVDRQSNSTVIQVVRTDTGAVIRQIPSQELIDLSNNLEKLKGLIFDESF